MDASKAISAPEKTRRDTAGNWVRFILVFAALLGAAELLLRGNTMVQYELALWFEIAEVPAYQMNFLTALSGALSTFFLLVGIFIFIEWRQLRFDNFRERYADGLIYSAFALSISVLVQTAEYELFGFLNIRPFISSEQLGPILIVVPALYLLALGFMEYWLHRALHSYEFLWRFHAIHHQIEHLNASRSYSHFGETFIYILVITTPLILFVDVPQNHIVLATTFYLVSNYYMHSDSLAVSFPAPLRHLVADNVYHHYHHTRDARHHGKNYASFLPIFDRLFGTQHMPKEDVLPVTGIDGYRPVSSIMDYSMRPFRRDINN